MKSILVSMAFAAICACKPVSGDNSNSATTSVGSRNDRYLRAENLKFNCIPSPTLENRIDLKSCISNSKAFSEKFIAGRKQIIQIACGMYSWELKVNGRSARGEGYYGTFQDALAAGQSELNKLHQAGTEITSCNLNVTEMRL